MPPMITGSEDCPQWVHVQGAESIQGTVMGVFERLMVQKYERWVYQNGNGKYLCALHRRSNTRPPSTTLPVTCR